jgi:hypothetical protein
MSCYTGFFNVRRGWQSINEVCQHTFSIFSIFDLGIREGANEKYVFTMGSAAQFFFLGTNLKIVNNKAHHIEN